MDQVEIDDVVRRCPRCAEDIRPEATRCRHCQFELAAPPSGEAISRWMSKNPTLTVSMVTFLYVVFQIYKSGEFEVNTTVELLRAGGLTSILVGVLLVQLPLELVLLGLIGCWWLIAAAPADPPVRPTWWGAVRRLTTNDPRITPMVLLAALLVLSFYTNPWPFFVFSAALTAVAIAVVFRGRTRDRPVGTYLRRLLAVLIVAAFLVLVQRPTTWVPSENVTTANDGTIVAYVVADDGTWATLLTPGWTGHLKPGDNSVRRIPTEEITAREPCALEFAEARLFDRILRLRLAQVPAVLRAGRLPPPLTPTCP